MYRILFSILIFLVYFPLTAQQDPQPPPETTESALAQMVIPPADLAELAHRLLGVQLPAAADNRTDYQIGDTESFWVSDSFNNQSFEVEAVLAFTSEYAYFWVEEGSTIRDLKGMARAFDRDIYVPVRELWGSEPIPGVDGDPRLHVLFARRLGISTAAYFSRRHGVPEEALPGSNAREMFFVNLDAVGSSVDNDYVISTLAHEFQHMIREYQDGNEDTWLNEALSTFTENYLGYAYTGFMNAFLLEPTTQLNTFGLSTSDRGADYGAGQLFVTYFYERFGEEMLKEIAADEADGMEAFEHALAAHEAPSVDEVFADWVVANLIQDSTVAEGQYGYTTVSSLQPVTRRDVRTLNEYSTDATLNQYATHYYTFNKIPTDYDSIQLDVSFAPTVALAPAEPYSGDRVWYSNRADASDMRLTRAFDLTEVDSATLNYAVWYEIEEGWDYTYLVVSDDGGETWTFLDAPSMTDYNPQSYAYSRGYSGYSDGWYEEAVDLTPYAGKEILLRFEMITDDAVNEAGLLVDDVAIPEIGYFSDFEADNGGWTGEGWSWTDNLLQQQAWIQVVQYHPEGVTISRQLAQGNQEIHLALEAGVSELVVVVSPFAPVTTTPVSYTLRVKGE